MPTPTVVRKFKKKAVFFALEAAYNDATVLTGADWFEARNMTITPFEADTLDRNIEQPYMGNGGKLIVSKRNKLAFDVALASSGTPGTAPKIGKLLRACGWAETLTASGGDTAAAGGASSITLAAGASATNDAYNGRFISITGGTGSGQTRVISDYVGSTKVATVGVAWATVPDATSVYSILGKAEYTLVSSGFESGAYWYELDGVRHKGSGVRGTVSAALDAKSIPLLKFDQTALYTAPTDETPLVEDRTGWPYERPINSANTLVCKVNGVDSFYSKFGFTQGNKVQHDDLAGGYEAITIADRNPTAQITILAPLLATFDPFALADASTAITVQVVHGTAPGSTVLIDLKVRITGVSYEDINGSAGYNLTLSPEAVTGNDEIKATFL